MKQKVKDALKGVSDTIDDTNRNVDYITVSRKELETLVKWAKKQAKKVDPEVPLKVGDRVKSKIDYPALPFVVKGAEGVIDLVDEDDWLYPFAVLLDDDKRGNVPRRVGFKREELKKVG